MTNAPMGPGATSYEDAETEEKARREAGEFAEAVAGVDAEQAAPIPAEDTETLATPGTASSEPAP
jgi:predicted RNase H-like HicB family nuclease